MKHNIKPELVPALVKLLKTKQQCRDYLSIGPEFFCFNGLVCELFAKEHPEWEWKQEGHRRMFFKNGDETRINLSTTPLVVAKWACDGYPPRFLKGEVWEYADGMNDNGTTFAEFVKLLEEQ